MHPLNTISKPELVSVGGAGQLQPIPVAHVPIRKDQPPTPLPTYAQ
jgi:hypothetical protein